ncbi:MAG: PEGA domain-containing protein [Methanoregulaceae archaeon]|nr:PEGA domain-containing protein [Methanoregulaceae archaeon]
MKKFFILLGLAALIGTAAAQTGVAGGSMGVYRVHCNINGALVYFDGVYKGNTTNNILDVPVMTTGTPYRSFTVEKEGYKPYTGAINTVPAKGQVINLYSTLSALPVTEYGTIHLVVTPTMARVIYDGTDVGIVPPTGMLNILNVPPGPHVVTVTKDGFATNTTTVEVKKNDYYKLFVSLQPLGTADLSVSSSPPGAQVSFDGTAVGVTPLVLSGVTTGSHMVRITMPGFTDYEEQVTVTETGGSVAADLTPLPAVANGFGRIPLNPLLALAALSGVVFFCARKTS